MSQSSASVCARIQIMNPKSTDPTFFEDGCLFLDTDPTFEIRTTRKLEELVDINKINVDQVLPFNLPRTPKNDIELGEFVNLNQSAFLFKPLSVQVFVGGHVLPQSRLHVQSSSEIQQDYSVELRNDDGHWIKGCKKLKCKDIVWDDFTMTYANIINNFENNSKYNNGDIGIYFPLAYYGAFYEKGNVTISDIRPWVHLLAILQKGFRDIGWVFKCPFLETDFGRRLICYFIDSKHGTDEFSGKQFSVSVRTGTPSFANYTGRVLMDTEDIDVDNAYNPATGEYRAEGIFDLVAEVTVSQIITPLQSNTEVSISLIKESIDGTKTVLQTHWVSLKLFYIGKYKITAEAKFVPLTLTDKVYVEISFVNNRLWNWIVTFNANPTSSIFFPEGHVLKYPKVIGRTLRLYDVLMGLIHLIDGKIDTDFNNRTVTIHVPFGTAVFGENIPGYFREDTIKDIRYTQVTDSTIVTAIDIDRKRFLRLQFKDATDKRIEGLKYSKEEPPFSKLYDISDVLEEDTEISANPLFEPTICDDVFDITTGPFSVELLKIGLPFLVDNDEGKPSSNIGPRILYAAGDVIVKTPEGAQVFWRFNNEIRSTVPYAFQFTTYLQWDGSNFERYLVYGDRSQDMFNKFWRRDVIESTYNYSADILHYSLPKEHFGFSFRDYYRFISRGNSVIGRLVESRDFDGCGNYATPLKLIPQSNRPSTFLEERTSNNDNCSKQIPVVTITEVPAGTYTVSIDNSAVVSTIVSQTVRWKYLDEFDWTVGTVIVDPDRVLIVQVQTEIEECPDNFVYKILSVCADNSPAFVFSAVHRDPNDNTKWCVTIDIGGILYDPILSTDIDLSIDGVAQPGLYTPGTEICGIVNEISLIGEVQFDNECAALPVQANLLFDEIQSDCSSNLPQVTCVHIGLDAYGLELTGSWLSTKHLHFFQTRPVGGTEEDWVKWDGHEPLIPGEFEARAVVFWNDECPSIFTEPVVCPVAIPLLGMMPESKIITKHLWEMDNYTWDWEKLSKEEKIRAKKLYDKKDWGVLMKLHNDNALSYHTYGDGTIIPFKFCCGAEHVEGIKAWFKQGIEDGHI